jgi:hypothetical protein
MAGFVQPPPRVPQTSGMAITSFVLGICSFFCWIFTGLPALILGIFALNRINRSGGMLTGSGLAIAGIAMGAITSFLVLPIMVALLLPAVQAAREAARRNVSMNNMKQIQIAMLNYHEAKGTFPAAKGGEGSQLSWRVHLLPYLDEAPLYERFHLDEPWDSEHNRALIAQMPAVFENPSADLPAGKTSYLAVTGPGTAFGEGNIGPAVRDFRDGTSQTIVLVEADPDQAVEWTKPQDWQYDPTNPTNGLGSPQRSGFLAATADGMVRYFDIGTDAGLINAMMTRDGGEQVIPP